MYSAARTFALPPLIMSRFRIRTAIVYKGSDPDESGNLPLIQGFEFGQCRDQDLSRWVAFFIHSE